MRLGKKAQESSMTPMRRLILFMIILVLLLIFTAGVLMSLRKVEDETKCMLSVMRKFGSSTAKQGESDVALECYTQELIIKEDGIYKIGSDRKEEELDPLPKEGFRNVDVRDTYSDIIARAVVGEIISCRKQFFEGKLSLYGPGFFNWLPDSRCIICSEMSFESLTWVNDNPNVMIDITEFLNKPKNEDLKKKVGGDLSTNYQGKNYHLVISPYVKTLVMFKVIESAKLARFVTAVGSSCAIGAGIGAAGLGVGVIPGGIAGCIGGFIGAGLGAATEGDVSKGIFVVGPAESSIGQCDRLY
jgi:hypothetical protein